MLKAPAAPPGSPAPLVAAFNDLVRWVQTLTRLPQARKVYTLATLPTAADFAGSTVAVSNGSGGMPTVTSINDVWTYPDGTTV
jgi:hypothetical protein